MSEKIKRSLRTLAILLTALVAVFVMFFTVACGDDESGDPFGGDIIQTDYDFIVKIIGTKTEEVKLKSGDTLVNHEPLAVPKKSGERFVGWYADGENTPYDWTRKVTKDMTIRARFEKVEGLKVVNGIAFPQTDGGISTGAKDTLAFIDDEFTRGSISASVTPVAANNDCGIVFGADIPDEGADWENFDYFIVIINKDGILIFAKIDSSQPQVNRWTPISESEILRASYDPSKTYNIKIGYDNGFCTVSVDGRLCLANDIGMLYGPSVGYRAQIGGTVFGPLTVDAEDLPSRPASGNYDALSGALIGTTDGAVECLVGNTIAVAKTEQTDRISFTMHGFANSDDGIVFGLTKPENGGEYWEGSETSYYFFFVGENGNARLAKIEGGWNEPFISVANVRVETADRIYKLEVLLDGNDINCFVNGVKVFGVTDSNKLTGTYYGVRAKTAGVTFKENDVADKHAVITDGANVGLMFVADGDTAEKPADPQKAGYVFDNWYVGDSQTPYDWATPVTDDMTITARFTDDESTDYIVTTGAVRKVSGGYETTADRTCVFTKDRFTEGTLTATVTPSVSNNDCGIIFGANLINSAEWENFNYFMVLINKDGVLLFARSPWQEISSVNLATKLGGFSASQAYSITVKYVAAGGYVEIYVNNQKMLSAVIGSLYGNRIGYRADKAGTLFYDYAIDANDKPTVPETNVGAYTVRSGRLSAGENGAVTTTEDNTLALLTSKSHGSIISFTMSRTTAADDGIVFGLTDNGAESYW